MSCTISVDHFFFVLLINDVSIEASAHVIVYKHEKKDKKREKKMQTSHEIMWASYNHAPYNFFFLKFKF